MCQAALLPVVSIAFRHLPWPPGPADLHPAHAAYLPATMRLAAIDCGTDNLRMAVRDVKAHRHNRKATLQGQADGADAGAMQRAAMIEPAFGTDRDRVALTQPARRGFQ